MYYFNTLLKKWLAGIAIILVLFSITSKQAISGGTTTLLASYPLLSNTADASGNFGNISLSGNDVPPTVSNGVCLNGIYILVAGGQNATTPNISTLTPTDFNFSVDFNVSAYNPSLGSPIIMGGNAWRWGGIYLNPAGQIGVKYNNSYTVFSNTTVPTGGWHNAVLTYNGSTLQLFYDGNVVVSTSVASLTTGANYNFQPTDYSNARAFNGCIRNLQIYNGNVNVTVYTLNVSSLHGSVVQSPNSSFYESGATVQLTPTPASKFAFSHWTGNVPIGHENDNPLTLTMDGNKTLTAVFDTSAEYLVRYRTAKYQDWALSADAKGKRVSAKRKFDKNFFEFTIVADTVRPLKLDFGMKVTALISRNEVEDDTVLVVNNLSKITDSLLSIMPGETLLVAGTGTMGKKLTAKYSWGKKKAVSLKADSLYDQNIKGLPMPNLVNVGEELFPKGFGNLVSFFPKTGMVLGIPQGLKKANSMLLKKYADVLTTLAKKGKNGYILDTANVRCLDSLGKKAISKQLGATGPDKYQNKLLAEVLALKLNLAASMTQKFPAGLGELTYYNGNDPTNSFNNLMVSTISQYADSMLSCLTLTSIPTATLGELYSTIRNINGTFADSPYSIDTISFGSKTQLKGIKRLYDVSFLRPTTGVSPKTIVGSSEYNNETPKEFALHQNYPNPFNPTTTLSFVIGNSSMVTLKVFNLLGQEVASLLNNENVESGMHEVTFDAGNFASGVYFYRITTQSVDANGMQNTFTDVKRMMLIK